MKAYNVLLLGSGGRESALAWKLRQSKYCKELYIAPGNAGTAQYGTNLNFSVTDFESIKQVCLENHIDLVLLGVYLHGLAADFALENQSVESMIAGDIIEHLGRAFRTL